MIFTSHNQAKVVGVAPVLPEIQIEHNFTVANARTLVHTVADGYTMLILYFNFSYRNNDAGNGLVYCEITNTSDVVLWKLFYRHTQQSTCDGNEVICYLPLEVHNNLKIYLYASANDTIHLNWNCVYRKNDSWGY